MAQSRRRSAPKPASADPQRSGNPAVRAGERPARTPEPRTPEPTPVPERHPGNIPDQGATYPELLRHEDASWKISLAGVIFGVSLYFLLVAVVGQAIVALVWAITHPVPYREFYAQAFAFERPVGLLAANLGIVTLIPISMVLLLVIHRTRTPWLFSVRPGIRWRYLLVCLGVSLVVLVAVQVVSTVSSGIGAIALQQNFWAFAAIVVLTSPLQAVAEEVFFRGFLLQSIGSVVSRPWVAVAGSALVFALMHGTQNPPLFVNRLVFGLLAGLLVWRTGGLEAGIAAHVANNLVAYLGAALTTSIAALAGIKSIGWLEAGVQIVGFAVIVLLSLGVARLMRLRSTVDLGAASTV